MTPQHEEHKEQSERVGESQSDTKSFEIYKNYRPVKLVALPTGFVCLGQRDIEVEGDPLVFNPLQGFDSTGLIYYSYSSPFVAGGLHGLDLLHSVGLSDNANFGLSIQYDYTTGDIKKDGRVTLFAIDESRTAWLDIREPTMLLQALKSDSVLPKSLDIRVVASEAVPSSNPLKYASLSFDSNPNNGGDPAGNSSGLYKIIMYAGAGFGCLMCLLVLMRYSTRSTVLENLEGDDSEPTMLAPHQKGVKESVVSMGVDHTTSENNSRL